MTTKLSEDEATRWSELLDEAVSALGDAERAAYEKRSKRLEGRFANENKPDVIRFLFDYAHLDRKFGDCVNASALSKLEIVTALSKVPDVRMAYLFLRDRRNEAMELENEDILVAARKSLKTLVEKPGCEINVKAVTFAMEKLDRKNFGSVRNADDGGRAPVVYNIPNLTMNLIVAPGELAADGRGTPEAVEVRETIDAELVPAKVIGEET